MPTNDASNNGTPPLITIVLVNYKGHADTVACLRSLAEQDYPNTRIIVVDNHSADDSLVCLRREFPTLNLIALDENRGFAAGNNAALRLAMTNGSQYAWVLNNDTVVAGDALKQMVAIAQNDPKTGAVGCCIHDLEHSENIRAYGGGIVHPMLGISRHVHRPIRNTRLSFLTAASILLQIEALREVGLFDEKFFMYWEDVDLCLRLRNAGWTLAVAPAAVVFHKEGASLCGNGLRRDALVTQSMVRFFRKHSRVPLLPILTGTALRSLKRLIYLQFVRSAAVWKGMLTSLWS